MALIPEQNDPLPTRPLSSEHGDAPDGSENGFAHDARGGRRFTRASVMKSLRAPIFCALVCGLTALAVTTVMPRRYRAETTIYFPGSGDSAAASLIGELGGNSMSGAADSSGNVALLGGIVSSPRIGNGPNTAMAVMASKRLQNEVIADCNLQRRWRVKHKDALKRLDSVVAYSINKNGLLQIEVADTSPALAATIAQSYIDTLRKIASDLSASASRRNVLFLEDRLAKLRELLQTRQNQLISAQKHGAEKGLYAVGSAKIVDQLAQLQSQRLQATVDLSSVNASIQWQNQVAKSTQQSGVNLPLPVPIAQQSRQELRSLESDFAVAQATLGPDNPQYQLLKLRIEKMRAQVRLEVGRQLSAVKNGIAPAVSDLYAEKVGLQAKVEGVDAAVQRLEALQAQVPATTVAQQSLTSEVASNQQLVSVLETELERAREAEARDTTTFVVMDAPEIPDEPFEPRWVFITCFAAFAGFLIGAAWNTARGVMRETPPYLHNGAA